METSVNLFIRCVSYIPKYDTQTPLWFTGETQGERRNRRTDERTNRISGSLNIDENSIGLNPYQLCSSLVIRNQNQFTLLHPQK